MKKIGILFGQERSFPYALAERINASGNSGVVAEPVKTGGVSLETPKGYDLILDRISQDIPFYRAILKKAVADGTVVVNNPFWWSADDKFFNNVVARAIGVAVPKTVLLPSNVHPPDTSSESMSNLIFPLNWDEIFSHIGFPAYFKPYSGGGWKSVYRVANLEEFFAAYKDSAQNVMTLQEEIVFDEYFRCYVIGRKYVHIMRYDPREPHADRYVQRPDPIDPALFARVHADCLKLVNALGYDFDTLEFAVRDGIPYAIDFLNPAPDADAISVGPQNFEWVLEHASTWLIERVQQGPEPPARYHWQSFLGGQKPAERLLGPTGPAPAPAPRRRPASDRPRPERLPGSGRTVGPPRTESRPRPQRTESGSRPERTESGSRPVRTESGSRPERTESRSRPERTEAPSGPQRIDSSRAMDRTERPRSPEPAEEPPSPEQAEAPRASEAPAHHEPDPPKE